jgi:NADH-quinone oxidoreductase subunit L
MADAAWLIPLFPLVGFVTILLVGRRLGEPLAGVLATAMVFASFAATVAIYFDLLAQPVEDRSVVVDLFSWVPVGDLQVQLAFLVDPLSVLMCLFVTGIAGLIHLFAIGYMHGDPKFSKFFMYLNLFVFSMTLLVLGENLLVTFLGWEGVGTCSYLLISFWHTRESAATAGKKAFVTNRIGDWGFMLAMFITFSAVGSLSYVSLNEAAETGTLVAGTATAIAVLLLVGACGKSAQLPLYVWLPDAMEGPTPVSALIHAATMVTAGVFLLIRINPVITVAYDWVPETIGWIGAITALFAATIALAQNDIKRVLAYSTVSQIGLMVLAVGSGAYVAALFHTVTHAAFKALLFLAAGSVIHGMHEEQDMRRMGALRRFMPITAGCFIVGWLAIVGMPPFSGFWSKDEVLLYALADNTALYLFGVAISLLTAFYMTRQVIMVFFGEARWETDADDHGAHGEFKPHESPAVMWIPLVVLAVLATVLGVIQLPELFGIPSSIVHLLEDWLEPVIEFGEAKIDSESFAGDNKYLVVGIAVACTLGGVALAWLTYAKHRIKPVEPAVLANAWYYDRAVTDFVGGPGTAMFQGTADFDATVVDGAVDGVAAIVRSGGEEISKGQTGYLRQYAAVLGLGVVALLAWFVVVRGIL